jgi:integrase
MEMVKLKNGQYYVRFRRHGQDIMVRTDARSPLEAKRIATNIKFLVKTGQWEVLDSVSLHVAVRLYKNRGWKIPPEIFSHVRGAIEQELTLLEAARLCYQDPLIQTQTPSYRERLRQCFKHLYKFRGPKIPVAIIDVIFVKEYIEHRIKAGAALDTVRRERTALAQIFDILIENRLTDSNPVRLLKWRPNKKAKKERRPFLSLKDFQKLLGHLPDFYRPLAIAAYYTGARQGELRCLTLSQLDLKGRMIRLTSADTKEAAAKRIPLRKELVNILKKVLVNRSPALGTDRVFLKDGLPLERYHLKRAWEGAREAAGFPNLRFHDLRHAWKTHAELMDRGIRMAIMGHAGGTHEGYGTLTDARLLGAVDSIDFGKECHSYGL